jgi:hypothetical protein
MNGVATEFAVEVLVHFKQRDGNAAASEEQRKHRARGAAAGNAAGTLLNVADLIVRGTGGSSWRGGHQKFHLGPEILALTN